MTFLAGQILTAADLNAAIDAHNSTRYVQGSDQAVTSATGTTLQSSAIVLPIATLCEVRLSARYTALGGGIRWAWTSSGTVSLHARDIHSPGSAASDTAGSNNFTGLRLRQNATLTEAQLIAQFDAGTTFLIEERLIISGSGTITFQFAQETSNASATTLSANSYATLRAVVDP